ncbi:MAG: ComF family protein [Desulfatiglandales bacterium]
MELNKRPVLSELRQFLKGFLTILFPPSCLICDKALSIGTYNEDLFGLNVCPGCKDQMSVLRPPFCLLCSTPFRSSSSESHLCGYCIRKRPHFDLLLSPFVYERGIEKIIAQFKYGSSGREGKSLGNVMGRFLRERYPLKGDEILIPVPLHPKREKERGFNQTLLLSYGIREVVGIQILKDVLRRNVYTKSQTGLNMKERKANVKGVFGLSEREKIEGKSVLLVDDVATTGSTLSECAKLLKRGGAKKVVCLVLGRAPFSA